MSRALSTGVRAERFLHRRDAEEAQRGAEGCVAIERVVVALFAEGAGAGCVFTTEARRVHRGHGVISGSSARRSPPGIADLRIGPHQFSARDCTGAGQGFTTEAQRAHRGHGVISENSARRSGARAGRFLHRRGAEEAQRGAEGCVAIERVVAALLTEGAGAGCIFTTEAQRVHGGHRVVSECSARRTPPGGAELQLGMHQFLPTTGIDAVQRLTPKRLLGPRRFTNHAPHSPFVSFVPSRPSCPLSSLLLPARSWAERTR